ncbi:MAG: Zn-dependent hydrolase [bacterium]|nr:Zn-dependent hydrolase [bacterium]
MKLKINLKRLMNRLQHLGECGKLEGGGVCRLALSDENKEGRDLAVGWMKVLGLSITVDQIGNVWGVREGKEQGNPVMMGSHVDTVATGGLYDGSLGVLAALEVIETLKENNIVTKFPVAAAFFTNEEGCRFAPDMLGSMVHQGFIDIDTALKIVGIDGATVGEELKRIGYNGPEPCGQNRARAYIEYHVEQGPVLELEKIDIGAVEGVQGISWTEVIVEGISNHAGTTPMRLRHDAGYVAMSVATFLRDLTQKMGGNQIATVGVMDLKPNLINVIPNEAKFTVDLRNTDEIKLQEAESAFKSYLEEVAKREGVTVKSRSLVRFQPVEFDPKMVDLVASEAEALGYSVKRMPSGAGHDAQAFAPNCPTAMVFVPSEKGISHNITEYTSPRDIEAGANVLLNVALKAANGEV